MDQWPINFSMKEKRVTFTGNLKFREKITALSRALVVLSGAKIRNCHGHFCKFAKIVTATFRFSRAFFWLFCHGQLVNFHGQNLGFFVTGIFSKSRALFQKVSRENRKMSRGKKHWRSVRTHRAYAHACMHSTAVRTYATYVRSHTTHKLRTCVLRA